MQKSSGNSRKQNADSVTHTTLVFLGSAHDGTSIPLSGTKIRFPFTIFLSLSHTHYLSCVTCVKLTAKFHPKPFERWSWISDMGLYIPDCNRKNNGKSRISIFLLEYNPPPLWRNTPTQARAASFLRFLDQHSDTPQSVGLLWARDRPIAETSTWQYITHKTQTSMHPPWFESAIPTSDRQFNFVCRRVPKIAKSDYKCQSVRLLSISPHGTTLLPTDRLLWNFIF